MRKCLNCQLVFYGEDRYECPYCNSTLGEASAEDVQGAKVSKTPESADHERLVHFIGSYFRAKSFAFIYRLSRHELKIGKSFTRFFIYPLHFGFAIKLPWLVIDLLDSLFFRVIYTGFCGQCGWKHQKITGGLAHTPQECDYNKEYTQILGDILTGEIVRTEEKFQRQAQEKIQAGKKSAWHDLSHRGASFELAFDVIAILISLGLMIFGVVQLAMPIFGMLYDFEY